MSRSTSRGSTRPSNQWAERSTLSLHKQLARKPAHAHLCIVAVRNCSLGRPELYELVSLPFGATSSVMSFNWVSRLLQKIAVRLFSTLCSCYVDDFPCLEDRTNATVGQECFEELLTLLGWKFADSVRKRLPIAPSFGMLGIEVDLTQARFSQITIRNTVSRIGDIVGEISNIVETGCLRPAQAAGLRGRFGYAYSFCFLFFVPWPMLRQLSCRPSREVEHMTSTRRSSWRFSRS